MDKRSLKKLEELAGRHAQQNGDSGDQWTNEGAVHQEPEHVLAVLRTLRDCGALGDVLKDERLELEALAWLDAAGL